MDIASERDVDKIIGIIFEDRPLKRKYTPHKKRTPYKIENPLKHLMYKDGRYDHVIFVCPDTRKREIVRACIIHCKNKLGFEIRTKTNGSNDVIAYVPSRTVAFDKPLIVRYD